MVDRIYLLILITGIFLFYIVAKITNKSKAQETIKEIHQWAKISILLGLLVIFFSGIPFFAVQYQLKLSFPYDRLSLPMILGSCLLIIGASFLIFNNPMTQKIFLSIVIGFSIGAQFLNANTYREDWDNLREFFWQLQWRVPDMEKETMLLTNKLPLNYYSDNSLSAPLNWIYEKPIENGQMPYILNFLSVRLGNRIPNLEPSTSIDQYYRIVNFIGNTSNSLVLQYAPPGCVHILDPELDLYNPSLSPELSAAIHLTNFERILNKNRANENNLPRFLGSEPAHNWCYYYEKAALLQQQKKWNEIVILGETAFSLQDYPNDPIERFPFIEAYAHKGDYYRALELSKKTIEISPQYSKMLCALWERIKEAYNIQSFPEELMEFLSTHPQCEWASK